MIISIFKSALNPIENLYRTPVTAAAYCFGQEAIKGTQCIDTLRLFTDCIDFSEHDSDGWIFLHALHTTQIWPVIHALRSTQIWGRDDKEKYLPLIWAINSFGSDFKDNIDESLFASMLRWNVFHEASDEVTRLLFCKNKNLRVDATEFPNGYSTLHYVITSGSDSPAQSDHAMDLLLENGADPHLVGLDPHYSSQPETPTSLALYTSSQFTRWRDALKKMSLDFEAFVEKELQRGSLKNAGWRQDTLLALFRQDFRFGAESQYKHDFGECPHILSSLVVEPCWLHWLQGFRDGMNFDRRPDIKKDANGNKSGPVRNKDQDLEYIRTMNFTDEEFEYLESVGSSIDESYDHGPERDESFYAKSYDNPALFEDGSVKPRLACLACWSKTKSVEWIPLMGSATPSSACTRGENFFSIPTIPRKFRR